MDEDRVRALVAELDAAVPREGAALRLDVYGGGLDESRVQATDAGALRLGVELLRASLAAMEARAAGGRAVGLVEVEYDEDSAFDLDHVELVAALPPPPARRGGWMERPIPFVAWVVGFLLLTALTIAILSLRG